MWAGDAGGHFEGKPEAETQEEQSQFLKLQVAHSNPLPCSHLHHVAPLTAVCLIAKGDPASKEQTITAEFNSILINHWQNKTLLITYLT